MRHDKIVRAKDGGRWKVRTWSTNSYAPKVDQEVWYCEKGKRTFKPVINTDTFEFRSLIKSQRILAIREANKRSVGLEILKQALEESFDVYRKAWSEFYDDAE